MQKDFSLAQQFALIGLDGQTCRHYSAAKHAVMRGIAAALILEKSLLQKEIPDFEGLESRLETELAAVRHMKKKEANVLEKSTADSLLAYGVMEIVPDLLGCDMNYETAGVEIKSYRSDPETYLSIVEGIRGEILEDGPVTLECVCLLWLIRESGCMHEIFSVREQERIRERMMSLSGAGGVNVGNTTKISAGRQPLTDAELTGIIWKQEFHKSMELMIRSFLKGKRSLFRNPYLEGVNLLFPFLDRRQAIFVDFVVLGTDVKQRRQAMAAFLSEKGHYVEEVKRGTETLLKIDNMCYRIWPKTVVVNRIPIQGANLLPVYQ